MSTIDVLSQRISSYLEPHQITLVKRAYYYAEQAHDGQLRRSGEAYITHPLEVASVLANMHMDHQSLMAAMLHDVIEDTGISKRALAEQFGDVVADLVDGVSKLTQIDFDSQAEKEAENFQKMAMAMARDIRVIMVKLADRLHNMRTLGSMPPEKKRRIAKQTLEIYAPIAHRLGMNDIRLEFENRCFAAVYPLRSQRLHAAMQSVRGNRKELVEKITATIESRMKKVGLENCSVAGREKHLYSIYKKMTKRRSFRDITDVFAFRVIVDDVDTCYRALGVIHNLYKPNVSAFKDYIAIPKVNGYQSLHTIVIGPHGYPMEVQIRTREMDKMANYGIAAHWLYKADEESLRGGQGRARQWIQGLLELRKQAGDSLEFVENVKIDLFPDEVYVFTPKGKIVELPAGSTAVDFAYAVHTDVGNTCIACRVNNRLSPLSQPLHNGERVTIITSEDAQPNPHWMNFVVTGKARSAIRHFLKNQRHHQSIDLGHRMLNQTLTQLSTSVENLKQDQVEELLQHTGLESLDSLLEEVGMGKRSPRSVARLLSQHDDLEESNPIFSPLTIDSTEGLMINFARCCRPIPGDPIIGHISSGKGLVIHQANCKNIHDMLRSNPDKVSNVHWAPNVTGEFLVNINVLVESAPGIIASLVTRISEENAGIEQVQVDERDEHNSTIKLCIGVRSRIHLAQIIKRIRSLRLVQKVTRSKN